jgi:photosystem II stability/assembly factor-like uncharacterized protein
MEKNQEVSKYQLSPGIVHLGVIAVIIVVVAVAAFLLFPRSKGELGSPPWEQLREAVTSDDASLDDSCGNDTGNGDKIISGPKRGARSDIDQDNPFRSLTVHPTNPDIVYVGTERNGIVRSKDGGKTWDRLRYGIRHLREGYPEVYDMAIAKSNPDVIYAAITGGPGPVTGNAPSSNGGVYKSVDGGETWQRKNCGLHSGGALSIWVDPEDENHAIVGFDAGEITFSGHGVEPGFYPGGLYQTLNGGETWEKATDMEPVDSNSYIQIIGSSDQITTLGTYGRDQKGSPRSVGIIKSDDNGKTWLAVGEKIRELVVGYFGVSSDGRTIYASSSKLGIWVSEDGGSNWDQRNVRGYIYIPVVDPANSERVFFGTGNDLSLTEDGFKTGKKVITGSIRDTKHFSDVVFAPSDPKTVYAIAVGYDLYKSTDSGETFTKLGNLRQDVLNKVP